MFDPEIARQLRSRGLDVVGAVEMAELRALSDGEVLAHATESGRVLVSENVQDFLPLHAKLAEAGTGHAGLLLTTHRRYPRTRQGIGVLVAALAAVCAQPEADLTNKVNWL